MRRVACYAAESSLKEHEDRESAHSKLDHVVRAWVKSKGALTENGAHTDVSLSGGRVARFTLDTVHAPSARISEYALMEPTDSGKFLTLLWIASRHQSICVFLELRAGGEALQVRPIPVDARCPDVYRQILDSREWFTGAAIVRTKAIPFIGTRGCDNFVRVLQHVDRNLPIVAVSVVNGVAFDRDIAECLARDLAGLAIVCVVDEMASWGITEKLGREWSCYNKGVRLYWPMRGVIANAYNHPRWSRITFAREN